MWLCNRFMSNYEGDAGKCPAARANGKGWQATRPDTWLQRKWNIFMVNACRNRLCTASYHRCSTQRRELVLIRSAHCGQYVTVTRVCNEHPNDMGRTSVTVQRCGVAGIQRFKALRQKSHHPAFVSRR